VVELFGGLPAEMAAGLKHMPPTLILHGDRDDVVPVRQAHALRDALAGRKLPFEMKVYWGVGHGFQKPGGGTGFASRVQASRNLAPGWHANWRDGRGSARARLPLHPRRAVGRPGRHVGTKPARPGESWPAVHAMPAALPHHAGSSLRCAGGWRRVSSTQAIGLLVGGCQKGRSGERLRGTSGHQAIGQSDCGPGAKGKGTE
jgi:hypothetical protein